MNLDIKQKFEDIYQKESDAIFRFCLIRVSNREQAMDITQETFLRLWTNLQGQNEEINNVRAFLFTIARRLVIDWYRKKKSVSLDMTSASEDSFMQNIDDMKIEGSEAEAEGRLLLDKINELTPSYRQAVYLRFVEGLMPAEIAEVLDISANSASVRINRGLEELRTIGGYNIEDK